MGEAIIFMSSDYEKIIKVSSFWEYKSGEDYSSSYFQSSLFWLYASSYYV